MAINKNKIENVRIQNRCHTLNEWDNLPAEEANVMDKEIAIVMSNDNTTLLGIVVGEGQVYELYNKRQKVLFPGIGAGYVLPEASTSTLGGIKINELYFRMNNSVLNPISLTYTQDVVNGNRILTLPENHNLNVPGEITATSMHYQNVYNLFAQSNYIGVRKGIITTKTAVVTCTTAEEIVIPDHISGNITFVPEITNYSIREQNTTTTIIFSSTFIVGETYVVKYDVISDEQLSILPDNEYEGIQFFNYKKNEDGLTDDVRSVAELSIDNNGMLVYSTDNKSLSNYKKIALTEDQNYFLINVDDVPTQYYPFSTRVNYNTSKSINLSQKFCTSINVNGAKFDLQDDKSINIGNVIRDVTGTNGLTNTKNTTAGTVTISHSEASDLVNTTNTISISGTSKVATAISSITRDTYGHLTGITTTTYDFAAVLTSISSLQNQGTTIQNDLNELRESLNDTAGIVQTLQTNLNNTTTKANNNELKINGLETRVSNLEAKIQEFETKLNNIEIIVTNNNSAIESLNNSIEDIIQRLTALENKEQA